MNQWLRPVHKIQHQQKCFMNVQPAIEQSTSRLEMHCLLLDSLHSGRSASEIPSHYHIVMVNRQRFLIPLIPDSKLRAPRALQAKKGSRAPEQKVLSPIYGTATKPSTTSHRQCVEVLSKW